MHIGTPKELKNREYRVGLTPQGAQELVRSGHSVFVETGAGEMVGFSDELYESAGCTISTNADELFDSSDMIIKVKEPQPVEIARLQPRHTLFTYLHLAPDPEQTRGLLKSGATCIAYETVTDRFGRLPLLTPMSEVAGRLSVQAGAKYLEIAQGGSGTLLGGVTGVAPGKVLVIGGGVAGRNAAEMAVGLGANVTILDRSLDRLRELDAFFAGRARCLYSTSAAIEASLLTADLVVGAVLLPGSAAPKVVSAEQISMMKPGSVVVDIAIDQGGCFETSRPTTHDEPVYNVDGVCHYCVTNMPAAVARTSTIALSNATLPYAMALADLGTEQAVKTDPHLHAGINVAHGDIVHPEIVAAMAGLI
ncbi:alanine dehydrogenase [Hyphomonas sp.]|uniref:alanine dehydrogenase n=1 Tax=Hyphomonas sp. TaxID=87 RepID=UPI000DFFB9BC|nr:alanine dehydrogenase [Hyphomonas sp.]RCL89621.1 MAG: alanine dehydrogenase [Hyphomonas sp.]